MVVASITLTTCHALHQLHPDTQKRSLLDGRTATRRLESTPLIEMPCLPSRHRCTAVGARYLVARSTCCMDDRVTTVWAYTLATWPGSVRAAHSAASRTTPLSRASPCSWPLTRWTCSITSRHFRSPPRGKSDCSSVEYRRYTPVINRNCYPHVALPP